jgi:NADH-quinone oxidoreductase subunit J
MIFVAATVATNGAAGQERRSPGLAGGVSNTEAIGRVLYTDYVFFFQMAGLVLLVAMIGAIVLTLRHKPGVKRQDIGKQVARSPKTGMELVQIKPGEGISE